MQVRCTDREFEQNRFATQQHRSLVEQMANSAFCLIMPGNSQSSQRLTEAFLTGCIPVFIGPPWHSLPLTQKVSALSLSLHHPQYRPTFHSHLIMLGISQSSQRLAVAVSHFIRPPWHCLTLTQKVSPPPSSCRPAARIHLALEDPCRPFPLATVKN